VLPQRGAGDAPDARSESVETGEAERLSRRLRQPPYCEKHEDHGAARDENRRGQRQMLSLGEQIDAEQRGSRIYGYGQ